MQHMLPAESAGVMTTLEPVGGDGSQIYIEGAEQYASRDVDAGFVVAAQPPAGSSSI